MLDERSSFASAPSAEIYDRPPFLLVDRMIEECELSPHWFDAEQNDDMGIEKTRRPKEERKDKKKKKSKDRKSKKKQKVEVESFFSLLHSTTS